MSYSQQQDDRGSRRATGSSWVRLARIWLDWRPALVIVEPETVITWHHQGFRLYCRFRSRASRPGRLSVRAEIRELIRRISREDPLWGSPRICDELALRGLKVGKSTVEKYMIKNPKPRSHTWRTFIQNHFIDIAAVDFFTVPTVTFRILYSFVVLRLHRRCMVHFNVTTSPTARWTAQQLVEAFPYGQTPRLLILDRDGTYGHVVRERLRGMGIEEMLTAPRSPWHNGYAQRLIGSIRRECLDHLIGFSERPLLRFLGEYFEYYHRLRPHQSLGGNSPGPRNVESSDGRRVVGTAVLGGLHHTYRRAA